MQSLSLASLLLIFTLSSAWPELKTTTPSSYASLFAPVDAAQTDALGPAVRTPAEPKTAGQRAQVGSAGGRQQDAKRRPVKAKVQADGQGARNAANRTSATLWRHTKTFRPEQGQERPQSGPEPQQEAPAGLQVSITPRVSLVQAPVESNAILKCLISAQTNNFTRPFKVRWSRFMYDESVHEQIDTSNPFEKPGLIDPAAVLSRRQLERAKRDDEPAGQAADGEPDWPAALIVPNRLQELRDFLARTRQETNVISSLLVEATLSISAVKANDNASYFCTVSDGRSDYNEARIDLLALSRPIVRLDRVSPARDSKSALVHWTIVSDGNAPIKKTILMFRNESQGPAARAGSRHNASSTAGLAPPDSPDSNEIEQPRPSQQSATVLDGERQQWQRIDIEGDASEQTLGPAGDEAASRADVDVTSLGGPPEPTGWPQGHPRARDKHRRSFNLSSLLPGATYQLRLAATNDMGQSNWSQIAAAMPNEIPAQISDIVVLSATNDSMTIGWRRPPYDGAKTIRYEMQLFDLNRTLTLDANTNTLANTSGQARTNFMFHFVNLNPGTDYHFHVRACSRAGCSAFSSPKLLASTLDGEPDEPLDVELACHPGVPSAPGTLSVSWLPPMNARGKLLNYSVTIESSARYRNQSGHWTSDEWRTTMDTGDNHTLGLEAGNLLMPNTNYTARVCANNRARRCGRLSQLSARSSCSTPAELPLELPANIGLALRQTRLTDVTQDQQQQLVETLALELPFISSRNGSIDCIQVVLVRLPGSFGGSQRALSDFLPDDPAEIKTHHFLELASPGADDPGKVSGDGDRAVAYLAEELDPAGQGGSPEEIARGAKQILLGDGVQASCGPLLRPRAGQQSDGDSRAPKTIQALDGPLIAQTYYTGFLKLLQVRHSNATRTARRQASADVELLAKYSNYFSPVRTGERVPQVPLESLLGARDSSESERDQPSPGVCAHKLVQQLQERLGVGQAPCRAVTQFAETARRSAARLYVSATSYLRESVGFDALGQPTSLLEKAQRRASPLEIGLVVLVAALLLLLVVYLFTLPSRLRKKGRLRTKRQLVMHEQAVAAAGAALRPGDQCAGFHQQQGASAIKLEHQQPLANGQMALGSAQQRQPDLQALTSSLGYQQVPNEHVQVHQSPRQILQPPPPPQQQQQPYVGADLRRPHECPVHSSPMSGQPGAAYSPTEDENDDEDGRPFASSHRDRRQSVHVCQQAGPRQQRDSCDHGATRRDTGLSPGQPARHAHTGQLHHQSAYQLDQGAEFAGGQAVARVLDYERNCRTLTRRQLLADHSAHNGQQQVAPACYNNNNSLQGRQNACADNGDPLSVQQAARQQTMTMQHNAVLALAKKIGKPLPLSLFQAVFESRLKSGWLRDEYEQLPRGAQQPHAAAQGPPPPLRDDGRHLRLRPQLIVSRDDSVSALISGNDRYDCSLIKLPMVACDGDKRRAGATIERQFICAKSPTDPDSVWDFWRLIYEREVSTLVMLTPNEDAHTGDVRCAQYWPTCDNEETTILSPCNEFVQQSGILPAKFKVRQETLASSDADGSDEFVVRRLTLLVMASKPSENEHGSQAALDKPADGQQQGAPSVQSAEPGKQTSDGAKKDEALDGPQPGQPLPPPPPPHGLDEKIVAPGEDEEDDDDEERLIIVERNLLHFQFLHWNAGSLSNQTKLIKFVELVNERHARSLQQQASPGTEWHQIGTQNPMLVHCANGIGRSGLFTAMSFVIDDLGQKLAARTNQVYQQQQQQQMAAKINLFQLVARMRTQRDMLLSPYRFYELLYQLTARCIPIHGNTHSHNQLQQRHNHHHHHHHYHNHEHNLTHQQE